MTQAAREQLRIWGFVTAVVLILIVEVISLAKNPAYEELGEKIHKLELEIGDLKVLTQTMKDRQIPPPEQVLQNQIVDQRIALLEKRIDAILGRFVEYVTSGRRLQNGE